MYDRIRDLPLVIDEVALSPLQLPVAPGFTRVTTVVTRVKSGATGSSSADNATSSMTTGRSRMRSYSADGWSVMAVLAACCRAGQA